MYGLWMTRQQNSEEGQFRVGRAGLPRFGRRDVCDQKGREKGKRSSVRGEGGDKSTEAGKWKNEVTTAHK